jgi:hypothetical protein
MDKQLNETYSKLLAPLPLELQCAVCDYLGDASLCSLASTTTAERAFVNGLWRARLRVSARCARALRKTDVSLGDRFAIIEREKSLPLFKSTGRLASRKAVQLTVAHVSSMVEQGSYMNRPCAVLTEIGAPGELGERLTRLGHTLGWRALYAALHRWTCSTCHDYTTRVHLGRGVRLCAKCASHGATGGHPENEGILQPDEDQLEQISCYFNAHQPLVERTALRGGILAHTPPTGLTPAAQHRDEAPAATLPMVAELASPSDDEGAAPHTRFQDTHAAVKLARALKHDGDGLPAGKEAVLERAASGEGEADASASTCAAATAPPLLLWGPRADFVPWINAHGVGLTDVDIQG